MSHSIELPPAPSESANESVVTLSAATAPAADDAVVLTVHLPAGKASGLGVVIAPGGGYRILASDHEGLQMARWLNRQGIAAFVLKYRLGPNYSPADALTDAGLALTHVRDHAAQYDVDPARIGMLGFSAGGHLASAAGTAFAPTERPAFLALVYPAIQGSLFGTQGEKSFPSTHINVDTGTPATFLIQTHEDDVVSPRHALAFYSALLDAGVAAEMHVFAEGGHGLGLAPGDPDLGKWPDLFLAWLRRRGLLVSAERAAVSGTVTLDGQPLYWGWVTFTPADGNQPPALTYIGWRAKGQYSIDPAYGPAPGDHTVTVHRVSTNFSAPTSGRYSIADAEQYPWTQDGKAVVVRIEPGKNNIAITLRG